MLYRKDMLSYYVKNGIIYRMIGWCDSPSAIMQEVETGQITHEVYDCLNAEEYIRLIPENEVKCGRHKQKEN